MSKPYLTFFLIGISLCLIQSALADCRDKTLYCFDSKDFRLGEISVGQCWEWSRLSCQPCSSVRDTNHKKITYERYLTFCRHFYPETTLVLDIKSVWANKIKDVLNDRAIGRKKKFIEE